MSTDTSALGKFSDRGSIRNTAPNGAPHAIGPHGFAADVRDMSRIDSAPPKGPPSFGAAAQPDPTRPDLGARLQPRRSPGLGQPGGGPVVVESRADDQPFWHSPQPHSTSRSPYGILTTGMEGIYTQYPTGFSCDVCDGIAVVDVNDGDHYLCAAHAIEPMMEIDLAGDEPIVTVADAPASASNVIMIGAPTTATDTVIADADVQQLLSDVVLGLRAIRRRLESTPV